MGSQDTAAYRPAIATAQACWQASEDNGDIADARRYTQHPIPKTLNLSPRAHQEAGLADQEEVLLPGRHDALVQHSACHSRAWAGVIKALLGDGSAMWAPAIVPRAHCEHSSGSATLRSRSVSKSMGATVILLSSW